MNHIKLLFFATIRDRAGARSLEMEIPADMTIQGLKDKLSADFPLKFFLLRQFHAVKLALWFPKSYPVQGVTYKIL